jgi:Ca-activated chloride channel family protein
VTRLLALGALALCALAPAWPQTQPQPQTEAQTQAQTPTFNINVHLVDVFVSVTTPQGAPVADLNRSDFALFEDGRSQQIAVFEKDTSAPLAVVLSVDTSGSVYKDMAAEQNAARRFVRATLRPQDNFDIMEFSDGVRELAAFTNNPRRLDAALGQFQRGAGTAFYSAIYLGAQALAPLHGRKVLVIVSDGSNTVDGSTYQQALDEALRDQVMIYSIIDVPIAASAGRDLAGEHAMITLSQQTGGQYFYANQSSLDQIFERISNALRTEYLLGYYPTRSNPDLHTFRSIAVKLTNPANNAHDIVHHRPGYYPSRAQ